MTGDRDLLPVEVDLDVVNEGGEIVDDLIERHGALGYEMELLGKHGMVCGHYIDIILSSERDKDTMERVIEIKIPVAPLPNRISIDIFHSHRHILSLS